MSLRSRMGAVAALAVALAVVGVAVAVYVAVRSELRGQVDSALADRARPFLVMPPRPAGGGFAGVTPGRSGARGPRRFDRGRQRGDRGGGDQGRRSGPPNRLAPFSDPGGGQGVAAAASRAPFGGASGHVQFISPSGLVSGPPDEQPPFAPSTAAKAIAARGAGRMYEDMNVPASSSAHAQHIHLRVLTIGRGPGGALQVARPLTEVDHVLSNLVLVLIAVGAGGILLAALLGGVVARTALAPVGRFTRRTESIAANPDLSQRLEVRGKDELARLARTYNATLDALSASVEAQRHLIADAGHELRTPIASLRANIQVLEDADRLPKHELEDLRADIVEELDELTALVADIVELARGTKTSQSLDDVRLDELVQSQIDRARRRAGHVEFRVELEPTVLNGDPERIGRAVSNLLDNARKWTPEDGVVEVGLEHGVLTVRDHGPGFNPRDLPHVFDRFYRADNARRMPGSGLGLAIVRQAADSHGGWVRAENAPDGGARVTISFGSSSAAVEAGVPTEDLRTPYGDATQAVNSAVHESSVAPSHTPDGGHGGPGGQAEPGSRVPAS